MYSALQRVKVIIRWLLVAGQITHTMQVDLLNFSILRMVIIHASGDASLGEERDAAWEEANKALMDDMPITALYYPSFVALVNEDQVENVELTLGNSFMFSHAEIVE